MTPISIEVFAAFHATFQGDTDDIFTICVACGGTCETNLIAPLLPGEAEFMASKMNLPVKRFKDLYLDGILVNGEVIDVIKCIERCQLLTDHCSCGVRTFKPVTCTLHPLYFERDGENWRWLVDTDCPLSQAPHTRHHFEHNGIQAVNALQIERTWYECSYEIFKHYFDYAALAKDRDMPVARYKLYPFDEIFAYHY